MEYLADLGLLDGIVGEVQDVKDSAAGGHCERIELLEKLSNCYGAMLDDLGIQEQRLVLGSKSCIVKLIFVPLKLAEPH